MKKLQLLIAALFLGLATYAQNSAEPDITVAFCIDKNEKCEPIGQKGTWDIDDANQCRILVSGQNIKGKKVTVKIFREGRIAAKSTIDDLFEVEVQDGKICKLLHYKFEKRGDYYVNVLDENGTKIGSGHVDMEEDMF